MVKRCALVIMIVSFFCLACSKKNQIAIIGEFPVLEGTVVRLAFNKGGKRVVIEKVLKEGKFKIVLDTPEIGVYNFGIHWPIQNNKMSNNNKAKLQSNYYGISKEIYIDYRQASEFHIKPATPITIAMVKNFKTDDYDRPDLFRLQLFSKSKDAMIFEKLDSLGVYYKRMNRHLILDSLTKGGEKPLNEKNLSLASTINFNNNYNAYVRAKRKIIEDNLDSPIAAYALLDIGTDQLSTDINSYRQILQNLTDRARKSSYYNLAKLKIEGAIRQWKTGNTIPLPDGLTQDYKTFILNPEKYRYCLLEFWASWCAPCRKNSPTWNKLQSKYQQKGFQIVGISLDTDMDMWKNAIDKDNLRDWLHVSDLDGGFTGKNALKYRVQSIPYNLLLDHGGRLLAVNIDPTRLEKEFLRNLDINLIN